MKRFCVGVVVCVALMMSGVCRSAETEHKRGDFTFFVGPAPTFVQAQEIPAQWDPAAPGTDEKVWRNWLIDRQIDRRSVKQDAQYFDIAVEARGAPVLAQAARYQIEFNPEYQRLVLHRVQVRRDGGWTDRLVPDKISLARRETGFENDLADGQVTALLVLDDVRIGDVVRTSYTIYGSNPILAGQTLDYGMIGGPTPMLDARLRVLLPPNADPKWHLENGAPAPTVRRMPDGIEVQVARHAAPLIVDEQNYPTWYQPFMTLQIAQARTWGDVATWAVTLFPQVDTLPPDLEARIAQWSALPDPGARLQAALRAVQDEVRYFGIEMGSNSHRPTQPSETWTRRFGDCKDKAYLLSTILRKLKIDAVPALVSTERGKRSMDFVPTGAVFNHVIVRASMPDGIVYVDPTLRQQGGDPRDFDLADLGMALPVAPGVRAPEAIAAPRTAKMRIASVERWTPSDSGAKLEIETTYEGPAADIARNGIAAMRVEDISRQSADELRARYGDVDVVSPPSVRDDRVRNALVVTESYTLKSPFIADSGARALDLYGSSLDGITRLPPSMARSGPLAVGTPAEYRHEFRIALPKGWRVLQSKDKQNVVASTFDFARDIDVTDDNVAIVYDLRIKSRETTAAGATEHLAQLRKLREDLGTRMRFQAPPSRVEAKERDERLKSLLRNVMDGGKSE
ncbi:DUF3857 domain-containing transglutaminase family protein [Noviluteimonas gilva]|uniref:DUF3857 domain-containing protein n=1 Tax=Noviluteimonas gilva TaxID=2682097 RepID=A0A7C9LFQ7_9GAMM|nr:DUF3857 domain-containing protein [Lysobacter gilvus]MUV12640.1 DUF3857 domain-containing protein [Lysobacter gilvus]